MKGDFTRFTHDSTKHYTGVLKQQGRVDLDADWNEHVEIQDHAIVGAFSGIHQFCRVGQHAFIGGYSVVTKDALPYFRTVGNRARVYGVNTIGLQRKDFGEESLERIRRIYRWLFQSRLNRTSKTFGRLRDFRVSVDVREPVIGCLFWGSYFGGSTTNRSSTERTSTADCGSR